jgi:threonine synthase
MDVGDPSNFARLQALYGGDSARMSRDIHGHSFTDDETRDGMRVLYARYGYLADPHTAVGYLGLARARRGDPNAPGIVLATAHPAKFAESCRIATGVEVALPERLRACLDRPKQAIALPATDGALRAFLLQRDVGA